VRLHRGLPSLRTAWRLRVVAAAVAAGALGYTSHHPAPIAAYPILAFLAGTVLVAVSRAPVSAEQVIVALRPGAVRVEDMRSTHLEFVATTHRAALPHGFFAALGPRFLRTYHATFLASPHAVGLVASIGAHPVGFVVGAIEPRAHMRWVLRRRGWRLALVGGGALFLRPRLAWRFARTRGRRYLAAWRRTRQIESKPDSVQAALPSVAAAASDPAILSHVAVLGGARSQGVGADLISAFVDRAGAGGAARVVLSTLDGPDGAAGFYERQGWTLEREQAGRDGHRVRVYARATNTGRPE
jgi:GNAT superfamily N-acetyltransferase